MSGETTTAPWTLWVFAFSVLILARLAVNLIGWLIGRYVRRWIDRNHPAAGFSLTTSIADRMARSSKRPNYWTDWAAYLEDQDIHGEVEALAQPGPFNPGGLHFQLNEQAVRGYLNLTYDKLMQLIDKGTFHRDAGHRIDHTEVERFRENLWVVEDLG